MSEILLVGEQSTDIANTNIKNTFALVKTLEEGNHKVTWLQSCDVASNFPESMAVLKQYDVIILSDVGSDTLLLHPEMHSKSIPHPNRLKLIRDYVKQGGGLIMVGGWMSFSGVGGKAKYFDTFLEEALPVNCYPYDDRQERPEGVSPEITEKDHPIVKNVDLAWPYFLGYNKVVSKKGATDILKFGKDPLLSVWEYGDGRSAAFTTDCAPHWGPPVWLEWNGYHIFWNNLIKWLLKK